MGENTQHVEEKIAAGSIDNIPLDALLEARNALAAEYITLQMEIERLTIINRRHKKRIEARVLKIERYLVQLDAWLKGVKR